MKFMEPIETTMGKGLVIGAAGPGLVVATVTVVMPAPTESKPAAEKRLYPHRVFAWCETHQVWRLEAAECPRCAAKRATAEAERAAG